MLKNSELKKYRMLKVFFYLQFLKKNNNYLGIKKFRLFANLTNRKIIALGGISQKNLKQLNLVNCFGFAGISFFE